MSPQGDWHLAGPHKENCFLFFPFFFLNTETAAFIKIKKATTKALLCLRLRLDLGVGIILITCINKNVRKVFTRNKDSKANSEHLHTQEPTTKSNKTYGS